jgi:hypothetical protein
MVTTQETGRTPMDTGTDDPSRPQQAMDEARALAEEAKRTGADIGRDARQQLRAQADQQATRVAGSLHELAAQFDRMRSAGGSGLATDLVGDAGTRLDGLATRLDREGLESMLAEAKRFARNRPGAFLLVAAAAGAVAARVLKATDTQRLMDAAKGEPTGQDGQWSTEGAAASMTPTTSTSATTSGQMSTAPSALTSTPTGELADR